MLLNHEDEGRRKHGSWQFPNQCDTSPRWESVEGVHGSMKQINDAKRILVADLRLAKLSAGPRSGG